MLAPLDNEVIFKKAFTDPLVLSGFVKDIVGVDFDPGVIETEKSFFPKVGNVDTKYDVFAESKDHRVVVELQRVEYDYHFDRFLHYHNAAIIEMQKSHKDYIIKKTVYTFIFLIAPYTTTLDRKGHPIQESVLISAADPRDLHDNVVELYGHKLIFLNSFYDNSLTPENYSDWLNLISESVKNPKDYHVNSEKDSIKKAEDLIQMDNLSGEDIRLMKVAEGTKQGKAFYLHHAEEREKECAELRVQKEKLLRETEEERRMKEEARRETEEAQRREEEAQREKEALRQVAVDALIGAGLSEEDAQKQLML